MSNPTPPTVPSLRKLLEERDAALARLQSTNMGDWAYSGIRAAAVRSQKRLKAAMLESAPALLDSLTITRKELASAIEAIEGLRAACNNLLALVSILHADVDHPNCPFSEDYEAVRAARAALSQFESGGGK